MSRSGSQYSVNKLYQSVMDDVMQGTREAFLDEGIGEEVQEELRKLWEAKLVATQAVDNETQGTSSGNGKAKGGGDNCSDSNPPPPMIHPVPVDPKASVPIQITMPRGPTDPAKCQRMITIHVPAGCIHTNKLQDILSLPTIQSILSLPSDAAAGNLQFEVNQVLVQAGYELPKKAVKAQLSTITTNKIPQIDGGGDSSSEEDDDDDEETEDDENDGKDDNDEKQLAEAEADDGEAILNSGDDVSEPEESNKTAFDVENVVVCQYDKVTRTRNKWKFQLSHGVMHLNGKDLCVPESRWGRRVVIADVY